MDDIFHCDYCTAIFSDVAAIENHMYGHLMSTDDALAKQHNEVQHPMIVADERKRKNPRHTQISSSVDTSIGDERKGNRRCLNISVDEESVKLPTLGDCEERLGKCCICDKIFTNCFDYEIHIANESISMEFQCSLCQMFFENSELLESHRKENKCSDLERFAFDRKTDAVDYEFCAECGNCFEDKHHLGKHYIRGDCWKFKERKGISYQCGKCDQTFTTFNEWSFHEDTHIPAKHFRCVICLLEWTRFTDYNKHIETIHEEVQNKGSKHIYVYKCAKCHKSFDTALSLLIHDKTHLDMKPFKCFTCPIAFTDSYYLRQHRETAHGQLSKDMLIIMKRAMKGRVGLNNQKQYRCPICQSDFSKRREYQLHKMTEHQDGSCYVCNRQIPQLSELKHHVAAHIGFTQCPFCNASIHNNEMWSTHIPCNASLFSCKRCGENFPDVGHLRLHSHRKKKKDENTRSKLSFLCEECGKVCFGTDQFHKHQMSHIKPTMEFQCDDCKSKHFGYMSLMKHRHIHHNEGNVFRCEVCNKMFTSANGVKVHLRRLHRKDTESINRPAFECDKCDQKFTNKRLLKKHSNVHMYDTKPYKCDQCEVAFALSCNLTKHKLLHTNEKPYSCDTCEAAFSHQSDLIKHRYIHTRDFPYNCDKCGVGFAVRRLLVIHTQRYHGPLSQFNRILKQNAC